RRVFHFVEPGGAERPRQLPHFLYLNGHAGVPWSVGEDWGFDVGVLRDCVRQPAEWKERHHFPQDVADILDLPAAAPAPAWQRVIVDRPERLPAALALTGPPDAAPHLLGFPVRQEGWALQAHHPVFVLSEDWHLLFPELAGPPAEEVCRQAW